MKTTSFLVAATALVASATALQLPESMRINADVLAEPVEPTYYQLCGADIVVPDEVDEVSETSIQCLQDGIFNQYYYGAVSWNDYKGGTCWKKSRTIKRNNARANEGVESLFIGRESNMTATKWFQIDGNQDMKGYDISNQQGQVLDCLEYCEAIPNCYGFSWNDYLGGTCWLKGRASTFVPTVGTVSGFLGRSVTYDTVADCPMPYVKPPTV